MNEPREIFELKWVRFDTPTAAETDDIAAAQDFDDVTGYAGTTETDNTLTLASIATRLEWPRNVVLTVTGGNLTAGIVTVYGTGMTGRKTKEVFTLTGNGTYTGNIPFVTIDRASVYGCTGSLGASDHVSIGVGAKIGLPMADGAVLQNIIKERFNGAEIAVSGTINRTYGTYTPASTLDGAKELEIWYTVRQLVP